LNLSLKILITINKQIAMKRILFYLIPLCFIISCSTTKNITDKSETNGNNAEVFFKEGTSFDNPVVIKEESESTGVSAEYAWLRQRYPGYRIVNQTLTFQNKKPYDIIKIIIKEGKEVSVYFDISNFYGKL